MTTLLSQEGFCSVESVTSHECARNRVNVSERGILLPSSDHAMPTVFCAVLQIAASKLCGPYNIDTDSSVKC
jgi:hypothetical protein